MDKSNTISNQTTWNTPIQKKTQKPSFSTFFPKCLLTPIYIYIYIYIKLNRKIVAERMAMRPRGGGGIWPVYEDFRPMSEWQQDAESYNLIIYLPGFMKEQIRVSTEGRNIIRVRGERLVAGNTWSRFLEDFQVPENCEMNSIRARFQGQGGILNITVPKKSVDKPQEALHPNTTSTDNPKQPTPEKGQEEVPPAVGASQPIIDQKSLETQNTSADPRTKQGLADIQRDGTSITPFRDAGRVVPQDAERKESSSLKETHIGSERADGITKRTVVKEERSKELPKDETARKRKLKTDDGAAATFTAKEKDKESKEKQVIHSSGADYGAFTMDRYKKLVKGLAELNDGKQLMVNMGVAVLVIMALSAYVTYKLASGEDNK